MPEAGSIRIVLMENMGKIVKGPCPSEMSQSNGNSRGRKCVSLQARHYRRGNGLYSKYGARCLSPGEAACL
jgi:hypothetical protein